MATNGSREPSRLQVFLIRAMNPVLLARVTFVLLVTALAWYNRPEPNQGLLGSDQNLVYTFSAFLIAVIVVLYEYATNIISSKNILLAACGLLFGLIIAFFFYPIIPPTLIGEENLPLARSACGVVFGYFGMVLAIKHAERFQLSNLRYILNAPQGQAHVLDTSAIIDGRITELLKLQYLRGPVIVPQFVLVELQRVADSPDLTRRAKGRRGLEVLEEIRNLNPDLRFVQRDYPDIASVDSKLIELARETGAQLVTNDYNLDKVASLQKVGVLNVNELANALRPTVYVGHVIPIEIVREGKEPHQGVGYLEDGTMVVVDEGQPHIGRQTEVVVSSILQTSAGRMVFARPRRHELPNGAA